MWNVMVFDDETKSRPIKVMEFNTIKDMSRVLDLPPQSGWSRIKLIIICVKPRVTSRYPNPSSRLTVLSKGPSGIARTVSIPI